MNILYKSLGAYIVTIILFFSKVHAKLRVSLPPKDGYEDINQKGSQHINGDEDLIVEYIQLANEYLWFSITVVSFVAIIFLGFKLISNPIGTDEGKTALKNTIIGAGIGIVIAMISYTIVRLTINLI